MDKRFGKIRRLLALVGAVLEAQPEVRSPVGRPATG